MELNEDQFRDKGFGDRVIPPTSARSADPPIDHEDRQAVISMMRTASEIHDVGPEGIKLHDWHRLTAPNEHGETHWATVGSGKGGAEMLSQVWHNPEGENVTSWHGVHGNMKTYRRNGPI